MVPAGPRLAVDPTIREGMLHDREQIAALGVSIDAAEVGELAASLIRIPTVPSLYPQGEAEAVACLGEVLDREQIPYDVEEVRPGRPNLVIEMGDRLRRRSGSTAISIRSRSATGCTGSMSRLVATKSAACCTVAARRTAREASPR